MVGIPPLLDGTWWNFCVSPRVTLGQGHLGHHASEQLGHLGHLANSGGSAKIHLRQLSIN